LYVMRRHTCYRVLGIAPGASLGEIREAYRKRIKEFHPDVYHGDGRYALLIGEAYASLIGKSSWNRSMEALAEELFPQSSSFVFPEFSQEAYECPVREEKLSPKEKGISAEEDPNPLLASKKLFSLKKNFWKQWAFPKRLLRQEEHMLFVMALLKQNSISIPPVAVDEIASFLGITLSPEKGDMRGDVRKHYCRYDGTLSGGSISYKNGEKPVIISGHILEPHLFYRRYVIARLLGYFLYYPLRDRSIMAGDFLSFFSHYDEEEMNTHRFAEELLLPESLFSVYGGKVLWYMEKGKKFSYETFLKKTSQLFQAPQILVEHRARKFEQRIRLVGTINRQGKRGSLLKEIEGLFQ